MKQRITFLLQADAGLDPALLDPALLTVTADSLTGPVLPAAREDRVTLALDDLPHHLRPLLQSCHELHISWVSPYSYTSPSPLHARLSPGFHLYYTPRADSSLHKDEQLCVALRKAFGSLDCDQPQTSFTSLPNDRFSHSAAFQYYHPLDDLSSFIDYAHHDICSLPPSSSAALVCKSRIEVLATASSLTISYDAISQALKVTATWGLQDHPLVVAVPNTRDHRVEVGILAADNPYGVESHELGLSGFLTVLGQDKTPSTTSFKFPARHRHVENASFSTKALHPSGLHPTLQIQLTGGVSPTGPTGSVHVDENPHCSPFAYLTLPRSVFVDKYQLSDHVFLHSKNLSALPYISQAVDLEAPDYVMTVWGSVALLELSPPSPPPPSSDSPAAWTAEVPLHLRYLSPTHGGYTKVRIPFPAVFWACTTEEGTNFTASPFDRVNIGYDGLFGPRTVFWHVTPVPQKVGGRLTNEISVPVLDLHQSRWVSVGTAVSVLLGFGWLVWKLSVVYLKTGYGTQKQMTALEKKAQ